MILHIILLILVQIDTTVEQNTAKAIFSYKTWNEQFIGNGGFYTKPQRTSRHIFDAHDTSKLLEPIFGNFSFIFGVFWLK